MPREFGAATQAERAILERHPARGTPPPAPRCAPLPGRVTTDYVDVGETRLLVRAVGQVDGANEPLLVVAHAPGSSALYEPLLLEVGRSRTVLALDLPGHGESDPLPGNPQTVASWAASIERLLDRLRIGALRIYGHNGGAAAALECAHRLGDRVRGVALDGPSFLSDDERTHLAGCYAPPVAPAWDGSHWLRAWHHLRDSELWWPWFERTHRAARTTAPRIDPQALTVRVREAMKQPESYQAAWTASLGYVWRERLAGVRAPVLLMTAPEDVFAHLLPAVRAWAPRATAAQIEDSAASRARALAQWAAADR
jgi:pimeloyl-ACP methyl ester carboxylesterase